MGGDVTGKVVIPLVEDADGSVTAELFGQPERAGTAGGAGRARAPHPLQRDVPARDDRRPRSTRVAGLTVEERETWFAEVMLHTFARWMALAEERLRRRRAKCFVMPGNDDPPGVDRAIEDAPGVTACDERVVELGAGYPMISLGYSNRTPFDSPRELEEDELYRRVEALAEQIDDLSACVFNLHVPPYASDLDTAPELDENLQVVLAGGAAEDGAVRVDGGPRADRALPAAGEPARPRPRVARGDADRPHAGDQPGQRLPHRPHLGRARAPLGAGADYQFVVG